MKRIQDKLRYKEHIFDVLEEMQQIENSICYLAVNPFDVYEVELHQDLKQATKKVAEGWDLWNIAKNEHLEDVVDEIASQYFFVR